MILREMREDATVWLNQWRDEGTDTRNPAADGTVRDGVNPGADTGGENGSGGGGANVL